MLLAKIVVCKLSSTAQNMNVTSSKSQQFVVKLCSSTTYSLSLPNTGQNSAVASVYGNLQYINVY